MITWFKIMKKNHCDGDIFWALFQALKPEIYLKFIYAQIYLPYSDFSSLFGTLDKKHCEGDILEHNDYTKIYLFHVGISLLVWVVLITWWIDSPYFLEWLWQNIQSNFSISKKQTFFQKPEIVPKYAYNHSL